MRLCKILFLTFMSLAVGISYASAKTGDGDRILGVYEAKGMTTNIMSHVEFYRNCDTYEARIIWLEKTRDEKGNPLCDINNPDPELRNTYLNNLVIIKGVKYDAQEDMWCGGTVYNPVEGKTYGVQLSFDDPKTLKVRGFIGTPMIGKNIFWYKIEQ